MKTDIFGNEIKLFNEGYMAGARAEDYHSVRSGGSYVFVRCGHCGFSTKAYCWSLAGGGKKCDTCEAVMTYITSYRKTPYEGKQKPL